MMLCWDATKNYDSCMRHRSLRKGNELRGKCEKGHLQSQQESGDSSIQNYQKGMVVRFKHCFRKKNAEAFWHSFAP